MCKQICERLLTVVRELCVYMCMHAYLRPHLCVYMCMHAYLVALLQRQTEREREGGRERESEGERKHESTLCFAHVLLMRCNVLLMFC